MDYSRERLFLRQSWFQLSWREGQEQEEEGGGVFDKREPHKHTLREKVTAWIQEDFPFSNACVSVTSSSLWTCFLNVSAVFTLVSVLKLSDLSYL